MAGKSVYLREDELLMIFQAFREMHSTLLGNPDLEKIRFEVEHKMSGALYDLENRRCIRDGPM